MKAPDKTIFLGLLIVLDSPFDSLYFQECYIEMSVRSGDRNSVVLLPSNGTLERASI